METTYLYIKNPVNKNANPKHLQATKKTGGKRLSDKKTLYKKYAYDSYPTQSHKSKTAVEQVQQTSYRKYAYATGAVKANELDTDIFVPLPKPSTNYKSHSRTSLPAWCCLLAAALGGFGFIKSTSENIDVLKGANDTDDAYRDTNPDYENNFGSDDIVIKDANGEDIVITTEPPVVVTTEPPIEVTAEPEPTKSVEEIALEVIENNPEVADAYNLLTKGLSTFSSQLGEDSLELIKNRVDAIGNGKVDVMDVIKILWLESNGRIYGKNGNILVSYTGVAFGPLQLTKNTVKDMNRIYGLTGTPDELDVMDPYDNLDACIYLLRFLNGKRGGELESGKSLPTGDSLTDAIIWSYHDGAYATNLSSYGKDYLDKYKALSVVDNYPEVVSYILGEE